MAELERIANHLGDIGAVCNDAAFSLMHAHCGVLRERVLRAAGRRFRTPVDDGPGRAGRGRGRPRNRRTAALRRLIVAIRREFATLVGSLRNHIAAGPHGGHRHPVGAELARQFAAGGFVGRASGRDFDARKTPGYPPYDALSFAVPVLTEGDVNARVWVRIREVEQSLDLLESDSRPAARRRAPIAPLAGRAGEGFALVEGFRGDIFCWVRLRC